jgi:hypothetical protein
MRKNKEIKRKKSQKKVLFSLNRLEKEKTSQNSLKRARTKKTLSASEESF